MAEPVAMLTLDHIRSTFAIRAEQTQAPATCRTSAPRLARHDTNVAIMALDDSAVPVTESTEASGQTAIRSAERRAARAWAAVQLFEHSATFALVLKRCRLTPRSIQIFALVEA